MSGADAPWLWLAGGLLLALAEIVSPGIFLIWIGAAALVAGLATLAFSLALPAQFATFAVAAVAAVLAARGLAGRYPTISDDPLLNDRTARLIGREVEVVEPIGAGGGRVRVGDSVWGAIGAAAARGDHVTIVGLDGGRLVVERRPALDHAASDPASLVRGDSAPLPRAPGARRR